MTLPFGKIWNFCQLQDVPFDPADLDDYFRVRTQNTGGQCKSIFVHSPHGGVKDANGQMQYVFDANIRMDAREASGYTAVYLNLLRDGYRLAFYYGPVENMAVAPGANRTDDWFRRFTSAIKPVADLHARFSGQVFLGVDGSATYGPMDWRFQLLDAFRQKSGLPMFCESIPAAGATHLYGRGWGCHCADEWVNWAGQPVANDPQLWSGPVFRWAVLHRPAGMDDAAYSAHVTAELPRQVDAILADGHLPCVDLAGMEPVAPSLFPSVGGVPQ